MKGQRIAHSDSDSENNARGSLSHSRAFAADRSPPRSPPKSWAWWIEQNGGRIGPQTCGGTAVIGEATNGDGDENGSREQSSKPMNGGTAKKK